MKKSSHIQFKNIQSYCCTCLVKHAKTKKYNIHQTQEMCKLMLTITSWELQPNDDYPKYLCQQCFDKLQILVDFRNMCMQSMHVLGKVLQQAAGDNVANNSNSTRASRRNLDKVLADGVDVEEAHDTVLPEAEVKPTTENDDDKSLVTILLTSEDINEYKNEELEDKLELENDELCSPEQLETKKIFEYKNCSEITNEHSENDAEATTADDELFQNETECEENNLDFSSENETEHRNKEELRKDPHFNIDAATTAHKSKLIKKRKIKTNKKLKTPINPKVFYPCELCKRRCLSEENLEAHLRVHRGLKAYQCKECDKAYHKAAHLKVHVRDKHQDYDADITCSFEGCGKQFRRDSSYRVHCRIKHSATKPPDKKYICEDCGRTFKNITMLKEHRFKHIPEEEYPYQCEQCGKRYTTQRTYKEHLMRHAGIKNFVCPYCGMKKTTRNELRTHINYHTKEKQWHCKLCPSVFNSSTNLGLHDRIVHKGIRPYACRYCEQSFGKAETLKHHEMRHTGEKPHACHLCGKRFIQVVALRAHLKTHNKSTEDENLKPEQQKINSAPQKEEEIACLSIIKSINGE